MKFQTTAIALAVAAASAVPMAVQAETSMYARISHGLLQTDASNPATDSMDFVSRSSRIGFKGTSELDNGLTASAHMEWTVNTDQATAASAVGATRIGMIHVEGGFGKISLGQGWGANYYSDIEGPVDIANWNSNWFGLGRTGDQISYRGDFGAVQGGVTTYFRSGAGDVDNDGTEVSASIMAGPAKIGIGSRTLSQSATVDVSTTGFAVSGTFGDVYVGANFQSTETDGVANDTDTNEIVASFGPVYGVIGGTETGAAETDIMTLGYTLTLAENSRIWFEHTSSDPKGGTETTTTEAIMRYDF